jgi:hypothetical protein
MGDTRFYCQSCGTDLTDVGGVVSDEKSIYCNKTPNNCVIKAVSFSMIYNPQTPQQIAESIKSGRLIHFGQLEKKSKESRLPSEQMLPRQP